MNGVSGSLTIDGFVEAGLIQDSFTDGDGASLDAHTPDQKPLGGLDTWSEGWAGIYSNQLRPGGNSGSLFDSRIFAGTSGPYVAFVSHTRGTVTARRGIAVRAALAGTQDFVRFFLDPYDADFVDLSWEQHDDNALVAGAALFARVAWAVGETKRMWMRVDGATVKCYLSAADGTGVTLVAQGTLSPTFEDTDHEYVGLVYQHYNGAPVYAVFDDFATMLLGLRVEPATVAVTAGARQTIPASTQLDIGSIPESFPLTALSADIAYSEGEAWLTVTLADADGPTTAMLDCDPTGLVAGVYHATVTFDSPDNDGDPVVVAVTFTIVESRIVLTPNYHRLLPSAGTRDVPVGVTLVTNGCAGVLSDLAIDDVVYQGDATGWLTATLLETVAPTSITFAADVGSLPAGTYRATIAVYSALAGCTNSPQTATVDLVVPDWLPPKPPPKPPDNPGGYGPPDARAVWRTQGEHEELEDRLIGQGLDLTAGAGEVWTYSNEPNAHIKVEVETDVTEWISRAAPGATIWE